MNKDELGRNDPCPCGSGKKYKKCCLELTEHNITSLDTFTYYNELITSVKLKLDQHYGSEIKRLKKEAQLYFLRFSVDKVLPNENKSIFSDYLWFDQINSQGLIYASRYLDENKDLLHPNIRECLEAMLGSYLSIYSLKSIKDNSLIVEELLDGSEHKILLKEALDLNVDADIFLLGRLLNMEKESVFSGMVLMIKSEQGEKEYLQNHLNYLQDLYPEKNKFDLFKESSSILYGLFDHAQKKRFMNLRDTRYVALDAEQRQTLIQELDSNKEYKLLHKLENFLWYKPLEDSRGYVRYIISEKGVFQCADILEDIQHLESYLLEILGIDGINVINSQFLNYPPPQDLMEQWFIILKDQEVEKWLNTSHSELDSKTPKEILAEKNGYSRIQEMLKQIHDSSASDDVKDFTFYIKQRIDLET